MSRDRFRIALYMRLSKGDAADKAADAEDGFSDAESNSIRVQRILLKEFVLAHFQDCELLEFVDDGYSGKNFERPGITMLLEMAKSMEVDCIIVKDFSRFSRDYIELGAYMEEIFPFLGVRFISVNDGYDSAESKLAAGGLDISFKNLLYDLYSQDLSVKVKSALAVRKEEGQYISAYSPFGYAKSESDRHKLCIAHDEAEIVKRIFDLTLQGYTSVQIARLFNEEGVKTPAQFRKEKGQTVCAPKNGLFLWQPQAVCRILENQVYVGDIVYGKTKKRAVGGRSQLKSREQWKIYRNHHEPIIARTVFELVQERRGMKKNKSNRQPHPLSGMLVCGACGRKLCIRRGAEPYFVCPCQYVSARGDCVHRVNALWLENQVLFEMQVQVHETVDRETLKFRYREALLAELGRWKEKKKQILKEEIALKKKKLEVYETYSVCRDRACGSREETSEKLEDENGSDRNFQRMEERERELKERLAAIGEEVWTLRAALADAKKRIEELEARLEGELSVTEAVSYFGLSELTRRNVAGMISEIVVYDGERFAIRWREGGVWQLCDTGGDRLSSDGI